jgi:hypothetical protein
MTKKALVPALLTAALGLGSLAQAETVLKGPVRVSFFGKIAPHDLPRQGKAPITVSVGTKIAPLKDAKLAPQLRRLEIAINKNGVLDMTGLPICPLDVVQPSTTTDALRNCRGSLVGEGLFEAKVVLKGQSKFPSKGKLYAFNSRIHGRPAILGHVYGTQPAPTSFTLIFEVRKTRGTFGTVLAASLPEVTADSGYVTGLSLKLRKQFSFHGKRHSYVSAGCPAPKGVPLVSFPFARATLSFENGPKVVQTLTRDCRARG